MAFKAGTRRVMMFRQDLEDIPPYAFPSPYTIGWYQDGDEQQWLDIKAQADQFHTADLAFFWQTYGEYRAWLSQRQAYLYDGAGQAVGTVTAWFETLAGQTYGKINWMLLVPEVQGRGLAKPLLSLTCQRLLEFGYANALLYTLTVRVPAINLYRRFGFVPSIRDEIDLDAWNEVNSSLKEPFTPDEYHFWPIDSA